MEKILISSCLLGQRVRYNAQALPCRHPLLALWSRQQRLVAICPEMRGGLPCPRPPAEIEAGQGSRVLSGDARVITRSAEDVTAAFVRGAEAALALCRQQRIKLAVLKAKSPSCGSQSTYDGSFSGTLVDGGQGVTAALLEAHGIRVFDENRLDQAAAYLRQLQQP